MIGVPTVRAKACGYFRDEDIRVLHADTPPGGTRPDQVRARLRGHNDTYLIALEEEAWSCSCGDDHCAHVPAVQMVTGYKSSASKPAKTRKAA